MPATHIRPRGADFPAGSQLSPRRLRPADLSLLAAMNLGTVPCARRPVVAVVMTGDELVMPGEDPGPAQIVASNGFAIKAMAEAEGAEVRLLPIARDTEPALRTVLALAEGADVIVTIGGASVGDHDLVARVTRDLGMEPAFWKIAMRPGKPLMAGRLGRPDSGPAGQSGLGHRLRASVPAAGAARAAGRRSTPAPPARRPAGLRPAGERPPRPFHARPPQPMPHRALRQPGQPC
jgi:molybdenum cofactor synthesis domain-containing protein